MVEEKEFIEIGNINPKEIMTDKFDLSKYFPHFLILGIILILLSGGIAYYNEIYTPKQFCESLGLPFNFEWKGLEIERYCDNKVIHRYSDGWAFEDWKDDPRLKIKF